MACTGIVLCLTIVHGGKVIVLVLHGMGGDAVGHLRSGVIFQRGVICHHAAKQCHIHRRSCFQSLLVFFFVGAARHSQLCQCLCLRSAHKEQGFGAFIIALDARILQRFLCQLVRIRIRSQRKDLLLHQIGGLFGTLAYIQPGVLRKGSAHGVLPRLRGYPGTGHTAVHGCFGAARIVPVDAAGRYGLQNVEINIQALVHKSVLLFILFRCRLGLTVQILSPPQTDVSGKLRIPRVGAL